MTEKYQDCSTVQGLLSRIIGFFSQAIAETLPVRAPWGSPVSAG